jgi:hypothetical protein
MRGPGVVNTDLSLFRTFKLTEKFSLQFRPEAGKDQKLAAWCTLDKSLGSEMEIPDGF